MFAVLQLVYLSAGENILYELPNKNLQTPLIDVLLTYTCTTELFVYLHACCVRNA